MFIDVPSLTLIEGQIKELQGMVSKAPELERPKNPGRIGLNMRNNSGSREYHSKIIAVEAHCYLNVVTTRLCDHNQE